MPTIRLPFPPSVNHYWGQRVIRRGRGYAVNVYIGAKGKAFRNDVFEIVRKKWPTLRPTTREVEVIIRAVMPDRRKRDVDNIQKAVLDALTHAGIWGDDSQVWRLTTERGKVCSPGWLDVELIPRAEPVAKEKQPTLIGMDN